MTGFVPLGQVCYWNTVCGSMVTRRQYLWDRLQQQSWSRPDKHGLCNVYGKNGKPYLGTGQGERLPLMFNLSHSGTYVAAAFGTEDVGVDVELIRTGKQKIAQRFFAEDERKYLEKCWTDEAFTGIWTRKEAYIKAVGTGIAMSLDSFSTMEEQVGEYYLKTWNVERDVWLSVCRKGSAIERCLPEKIALEQVFL